MAKRRSSAPADLFTSTEIGIGAALTPRAVQFLDDSGLLPAPEAEEGKARLFAMPALKQVAMIGAVQAGGGELIAAARITAFIVKEFAARRGEFPSRLYDLWSRALKATEPKGAESAIKEISAGRDADYWYHQILWRNGAYPRGIALRGDVLLEIVDRTYGVLDAHGWSEAIEPLFRIANWARGAETSVHHLADEATAHLSTPQGHASWEAIQAECIAARVNALGVLRLNLSLAIRTALDRIADHRARR